MRIHRDRSRTIFRRRNRFNGCLSWMMTLIILCGVLFFTRGQIRTWFLQMMQPSPELATLSDAQSAYDQGDLQRTIAYTQEIYDNDPTNMDALQLLVRSLIYHSYADLNQDSSRVQALSLTTTALEDDAFNMQLLGIHAFALQANGNSEDAQRVALRVIRNDDNSITARLALSLAYGSQGIFQAALRDGLRAVEIATETAPNWRADAYRVVAIAHSALGDYDDAATTIETAITHHRRLLALHFERALYAQQVGDMDTATVYYFNVIAFDEENVKARFRLCEVSSLLGERDAAIDWCMQVTNLAPGWAEGWYYLGREYYLAGDWTNTQTSLATCSALQVAQAVPIENRRFECWYIQGQAAEVLNDCESLITIYADYQRMSITANLEQTWVYPDDMPSICITPDPPDD